MVISMGWKMTCSELIPRYPGLLLMPVFTPFTFGPINRSHSGCCSGCNSKWTKGKFGLSFTFSYINIVFTMGIILLFINIKYSHGYSTPFGNIPLFVYGFSYMILLATQSDCGINNCLEATMISLQDNQLEQEITVSSSDHLRLEMIFLKVTEYHTSIFENS